MLTDTQTALLNQLRAAMMALRPLMIDQPLDLDAQISVAATRWHLDRAIGVLEHADKPRT